MRSPYPGFEKVVAIDPNNIETLYGIGVALYNLGKYEESITWFDKALEIDPTHVFPLYYKGAALHNLGKNEEAIIWYEKVLKIDPNHIEAKKGKVDAVAELEK
jgi:tetratricopeptide (TPR) repeat protein